MAAVLQSMEKATEAGEEQADIHEDNKTEDQEPENEDIDDEDEDEE